jgi:hypothetical protein
MEKILDINPKNLQNFSPYGTMDKIWIRQFILD